MNTSLFHHDYPFTGLFRQQAGTLDQTVRQLEAIFRDFTALLGHCERIAHLVSEGDSRCRQVERELSLTLIQTVDREDVRELNRACERAFRALGAVSSRLGLYGLRTGQKGAEAHTSCLTQMAAELTPLIEIIARRGRSAPGCARVRALKREADTFLLVGLGEVYESAGTSPESLLEAMKWSQIYDRLETAASCLEQTVNVIEGIILKNV